MPDFFARFRRAWLLASSNVAFDSGNPEGALQSLARASEIKPLAFKGRALQARALLKAGRIEEAQNLLSAIRKGLSGAVDPEQLYMRHWCTATIALIQTNPAQFDYEARAAQEIPCRSRMRELFPLPVGDSD